MAATPRKDFLGKPCGFSTEATSPHSGLLSFQPTFLLLLIAQLAVGKQCLVRSGAVNRAAVTYHMFLFLHPTPPAPPPHRQVLECWLWSSQSGCES